MNGTSSGGGTTGQGTGMGPRIWPMLAMAPLNTRTDGGLLLAASGNPVSGNEGQSWGLWASGTGLLGDRQGNGAASQFDYTLYGASMGVDRRLSDHMMIGLSGGYFDTDVDFDRLSDDVDVKGYQAALYAAWSGPWYLRGIASYGRNNYDTRRWIGGVNQTAVSDYDGYNVSGSLETGYTFHAGGFRIGPLAAVQAIRLSQEGFTETGAGIYNLTVEKRDTDSVRGSVGLRMSKAFEIGEDLKVTPDVCVRYAREFKDEAEVFNTQMTGPPAASFAVTREESDRDHAVLGCGLSFVLWKRFRLCIRYDGDIAGDHEVHSLTAGLVIAR